MLFFLGKPCWKSFKLLDGKKRWFYTSDKSVVRIVGKDWLDKNTVGISICFGYETEKEMTKPLSNMISYVTVDYQIYNYCGEGTGLHFRSERYCVVDNKVYQQLAFGEVKEIKVLTKQMKGILAEIENNKSLF